MMSDEQEGWVQLSFVVSPDGTVEDPIVVDSSGQAAFERAALAAVARQRYTPATIDGKPVEQCVTEGMYTFFLPGRPRGARRVFRTNFTEVRSLMGAGNWAAAAAKVEEMFKTGTWTNYEASRLHLLRYELCTGADVLECKLKSLHRAASMDGFNLEPSIYRQVLEAMASVEIQLELYRDALITIERRNKLRPPLAPEHPLTKAGAEIVKQIHGEGAIGFKGKVGIRSGSDVGAPNWRHQLLRREFMVEPGQGTLDKLEIRCDWRRTVDVVRPDKSWKVPTSWGNCQVFVFGDPDATLKLVEYPLVAREEAAAQPPPVVAD